MDLALVVVFCIFVQNVPIFGILLYTVMESFQTVAGLYTVRFLVC